jgi:flagellar P-ring protein FlgI
MNAILKWAVVLFLLTLPLAVSAERIKDIATILGVRDNQLLGYGLVVGLDGSGDQTTQTPFTVQSTVTMLSQLGVNLPAGTSLQLKNVAAVTVTATLPPFARSGQVIDITASSIGNAKSLRGGTLLMTPLKGADGQVYAMAQGSLLVSGAGAAAAGSKAQVNHLSVGRIPGGATVERSVPTSLGQGKFIHLELNTTDFTTASRLAEAINREFKPLIIKPETTKPETTRRGNKKEVVLNLDIATALDGRTIEVIAPEGSERVAFIARMENLQVITGQAAALVIINARTGSVVMNQRVTLDPCAVAHGNLTVVVNGDTSVSQPNALAEGQTVVTDKASIEIRADKGNLLYLTRGADLGEVVKALNSIGATPQDMLAILQSMKAAGALRADLQVI